MTPVRRCLTIALLLATAPFTAQGQTPPIRPLTAMRPGGLPEGFASARTGRGAPAVWEVVADPSAEGGMALAQTGADPTDYRYPLAIVQGTTATDLAVTVRFKAVAGQTDQAGGIAIRLADADNYLVVRANALEDNVNFYRVVNGARREIKGAAAKVTSGVWHTLGIKAEGDRFQISFDGIDLFTASDRSIPGAGRVALWTKADSVTRFDRLEIRPLR